MLPKGEAAAGLACDSPAVQLVGRAPPSWWLLTPADRQGHRILSDLGVQVRTNAASQPRQKSFRLADGQLVEGSVFVWAGGVKAPELVADPGLLK